MNIVRLGSRGSSVLVLQYFLSIPADGVFATQTQRVLLQFQKQYSLIPDGVCGNLSWQKFSTTRQVLVKGSKGNDVKGLQVLLSIKPDGSFGNQTLLALNEYQKALSLKPDGVCGLSTWSKLIGTTAVPDVPTGTSGQPTNYKQFDPRWKSVMFSSHGDRKQTIGSSGCGPSSMADILCFWKDSKITPVIMCDYAVKNGFRSYSSGTTYEFFTWCAKKWSFSKYQTTTSTDTVISALKAGALVIANMGPGYWTKAGHYICLWKYNEKTNEIYANDPGSSTRIKSSVSIFKQQSKMYMIFYK